MYRSRRTRKSDDLLGLDSLMDVLSCSIGVMLFVVTFAVIEAKGTNILLYSPPLLREPPAGSRRVLVLCQDGRVRILDVGAAHGELIGNSGRLTYAEVPAFVERANKQNVADGNFRYRLVYRDEQHGEGNRRRVVSMRVEPRPGSDGDTVEDLADGLSDYEAELAKLQKEGHWLAFGVDKDSLRVFRDARSIAIDRGFSTGWDPVSIEFPYEEVILGGASGQRMEGRPRSGLKIIQ